MFKHILFPTDGTAMSLQAARAAVELAGRSGARLSVLHVAEYAPVRSHRGGVATMAEVEETAGIDQVMAMALARGVRCTASEIGHASPSRAIVEFADLQACDLIVMGTHGKRGLERLVLGSQTEQVLVASPVPVLVCPKGESFAFERILLLIDGSDASGRAVSACMEAAAALGSRVYALNVISPLPSINLLADYIEGNICFKRLTSRAQMLLDEARSAAKAAGVDVSTEYTFDRRPDTVVTARATAHGCGMVVVPRTGTTHPGGFLHGVARKVLLDGGVPVLVCP